jgi:hypothetical protein
MTISLSFETSLAGKKLILPSFGSRHIGAHHCIAELSRNAILSRLSPVDSRKKTTSYPRNVWAFKHHRTRDAFHRRCQRWFR